MDRFSIRLEDRIYAKHGAKYAQGALVCINGQKALANYKGNSIVGYTTLDELQREFYTRDLPELNTWDFE